MVKRLRRLHIALLIRSSDHFWLLIAICLTSIWLIFGWIAYQSYLNQWRIVSLSVHNIVRLLDHDIASNIEMCDRSLKAVVNALADPEIAKLPPGVRSRLIADQATGTAEVGIETVLGRDGRIMFDTNSRPATGFDLSDMAYFKRLRDDPAAAGLVISEPFRSPIDEGVWKITLSRRINGPDGRFDGIVSIVIPAQFFSTLFSKVTLAPGSAIAVAAEDGAGIARFPADETFPATRTAFVTRLKLANLEADEGVSVSNFDHVNRFFVYRRIENLPLFLIAGVPANLIRSEWWPSAAALGAAFAVLSGLIVMLAMSLRRELLQRASAERALIELANTDALTNLANRRRFDEVLDLEWRRAIRMKAPLALVMIDCDFFKAYNDVYGHIEGDSALVLVADAIIASVRRSGDQSARIGGEEFAILLPGTALDGALAVDETIRRAVYKKQLRHESSRVKVLTISAGAACLSAPDRRRSRHAHSQGGSSTLSCESPGPERRRG